MLYEQKYLKYKNKYIELKNQKGGDINLNGLKYVIGYLSSIKNFTFINSNTEYICWINMKYKTLYIQNSENYNGDTEKYPNIRFENKLNIVVDDQYQFINCFEGKFFHSPQKLEYIPENWHNIVNILIKLCKINLIINGSSYGYKILDIPDILFNATEVNIEYYNELMKYLSSLNIHESINIDDIDADLYENIKNMLKLNFDTSRENYIKYINDASKIHDANLYLTEYNFEEIDYKPFDVSTNGAMAVITKSILNLNFKDIFTLPFHLITLLKNNQNTIIASYLNGYTSFMRNYSNIQYANKFPFITKEKNQNFLQWFIMSINPLSFFVPANSVNYGTNLTEQNILDNIKKCLIFYSCMSLFIKNKKQNVPNYMQRILFKPYSNDIDFNNIIKQIQKEQQLCNLSKFPDSGDGFGSSTPEDMLSMRFLDELYGHQYLDPRHLITILLGTQNSPNYRREIRDKIPDLLKKLEELKTTDRNKYELYVLQFFSRLKIARFEPIKLGDCIDRIKLDGMFKLTKITLDDNLSDDDIKMATYYFNKYSESDITIRCSPEYFYLNYNDITYNNIEFSVILKIYQSNEMDFILYSHNDINLKIDAKTLYDNIYKMIDITNINKTKSKSI